MKRQVYALDDPVEIPHLGHYLAKHPIRTLRCAGAVIADLFDSVPVRLWEMPREFLEEVFYRERTKWRPMDELKERDY